MAIPIRSMVATRLSFSGPIIALLAKLLSCRMALAEVCSRW